MKRKSAEILKLIQDARLVCLVNKIGLPLAFETGSNILKAFCLKNRLKSLFLTNKSGYFQKNIKFLVFFDKNNSNLDSFEKFLASNNAFVLEGVVYNNKVFFRNDLNRLALAVNDFSSDELLKLKAFRGVQSMQSAIVPLLRVIKIHGDIKSIN